ncbi:hypothetical protein P885DRAFT_31719 [Corynascus similis CBS 632.67]
MMRYRGRFGRSAYPDIVIHPSDEGEELEEKWRKWHQLESWKRLVFHTYLRDAQVSMTQLNNPSMSYAELTLPLPYSKDLWFARNAEEFKARYLESGANSSRTPSLGDLLRDISSLSTNNSPLDMQFAISIYLHALWSLIWEYRQLASVYYPTTTTATTTTTTDTNTSSNLLDSRRAELVTRLGSLYHHLQIQKTRQNTLAPDSLPPLLLLYHFLLFNLHTPLPDLQLFSGKEGEEQARRVYPSLQRWAGSIDARRALWHAAQVLKAARAFPRGTLQDFWSVAVCHAVLGVWGWSVVDRASSISSPASNDSSSLRQWRGNGVGHDGHVGQDAGRDRGEEVVTVSGLVYLDGEDESGDVLHDPTVRAWIGYGQGRPAIHGMQQKQQQQQQQQRFADSRGNPEPCLFEDPRACAGLAQEILRANFVGVCESLPPLTENIIVVLKQLEKAGWAVRMG